MRTKPISVVVISGDLDHVHFAHLGAEIGAELEADFYPEGARGLGSCVPEEEPVLGSRVLETLVS